MEMRGRGNAFTYYNNINSMIPSYMADGKYEPCVHMSIVNLTKKMGLFSDLFCATQCIYPRKKKKEEKRGETVPINGTDFGPLLPIVLLHVVPISLSFT